MLSLNSLEYLAFIDSLFLPHKLTQNFTTGGDIYPDTGGGCLVFLGNQYMRMHKKLEPRWCLHWKFYLVDRVLLRIHLDRNKSYKLYFEVGLLKNQSRQLVP